MMTTTLMFWIFIAAQAAENAAQDPLPDWPQRTIRFEKIDEPMEAPASDVGALVDPPQFAATFVIQSKIGNAYEFAQYARPISRRSGRERSGGERFLTDSSLNDLSPEQLKLMMTDQWLEAHRVGSGSIQKLLGRTNTAKAPNALKRFKRFAIDGTIIYTVYGVTEDDVRSISRAAVKLLDKSARAVFEDYKTRLPKVRKTVAARRERMAELEKAIPARKQALDKAQTTSPYADGDKAAADIRELEKSLRASEIEIAGLRAKMDAITKLKARGDIDQGTRSMLDRMLMQQDVEMAGALARRGAVESHQSKARAYHDLFESHRAAVAELKKLKTGRGVWKNSAVSDLEQAIRNPDDQRKPVVLIYDKVVIQPVKFVE